MILFDSVTLRYSCLILKNGPIRTENPCVPGSIPGPGTSKFKRLWSENDCKRFFVLATFVHIFYVDKCGYFFGVDLVAANARSEIFSASSCTFWFDHLYFIAAARMIADMSAGLPAEKRVSKSTACDTFIVHLL